MVFVFVGMFCVPAYASTNAEYNQVTTFWHWSKDVPLWGDWVAYSTDKTCAVSEDKYHHASTYQTANEDGYFTCICTYCGQMFTAYESDLKQSYDDQVAELPATGITSAGRLIWQTSLGDMGRYFNVVCGPTVYYEASITSFPWHGSSGYLSEVGFDVASSGSALSFSYSGNPWLTFVGFKCAYFIAPFAGSYRLLGNRLASGSYLLESGVIGTIDGDYSADSSFKHYSASEEFSLSDAYVFWDGAVSFASGYVYLPAFEVIPDTAIDTTSGGQYNINTRPTSITGGNYGIVGDNGEITTITNNNQIINETNNTYYNPATGETKPILDWSYNYTDRSYKVTLESGDTYTITYGDENIVIKEGDVTYNIYYMVDGTGSGDPDPSPSVSVCPHVWTETSRTEPGCTSPGKVVYTCSQCGQTKSETLKALGHDWQVLRTVQTVYDEEGNLVQQGYTIYQCAVCSEQYKDDQGTGPPGGGDKDDDKETIWDKIGNFIGSIVDGIAGMVEAVLGKLLDALTALSEMLMGKVKDVVEVVLSIFDELPQLFGGFLDFLGIVFPFLPSEITLLLTFGVIAVVFIGIIKAIRR